MADLRIRTIDESSIDTLLAADVDFDGELSISEPILIKGTYKGAIDSSDDVYVSEESNVDARVSARTISVHGAIRGEIRAGQRIEMFKGCSVSGSIATPDLIVQSGCRLNGSCEMKAGAEDTQ
jgi:cytoskeletal protein CcmA (bactofilin family)